MIVINLARDWDLDADDDADLRIYDADLCILLNVDSGVLM